MNSEPKITIRQLREMLFYIDDQDMTIQKLRVRLFLVENQDMELVPDFSMWKKMGVEE
jgi:hypothetical protein